MKLLKKFTPNHSGIIHILSIALLFSVAYTIFFSPVIFSDKLLAPEDGIIQSVPAFYSARTLWTDLILSGFPVAADPQIQTWYPIALLFSLIPNSWNSFVISAYVLASCFTYGYVYKITNSRLAGTISGIVYGMSGFMMAHLGHTMMIHAAAWMPLVIWSLENLRYKFNINWFLAGCFAIACCILAGHPQIAVYAVGLSAVYALVFGWNASVGRWNYYKIYLVVLVIGITVSAVQIIPTVELMNLGLRSKLEFKDFVAYSLPLKQVSQLFFPYLFGSHSPYLFYELPYIGEWNLTELTGYVGLLPPILAVVGFVSNHRKTIARFWLVVAIVALLLTLGDATPLTWLIFHLPAYNKFRVPARHFIEMTLAVSVLTGLGVAVIQRKAFSHLLLTKTILGSIGVMLVSLTGIFLWRNTILKQIQELLTTEEVTQFTLIPWLNPAVGIPLVIFFLAVIVLLCWSKSPNSKGLKLLLVLALIIDLGSFGWFYEWQIDAPSQAMLVPTAFAQRYKNILSHTQQRILPIRGGLGSVDEIPPNMSRLWEVPSASGYGPLILSRFSQLLSMGTPGDISINQAWTSKAKLSLDIMSIRYVFIPKSSFSVTSLQGINWSKQNMTTQLGSACGSQQPNSVKFLIPPGEPIANVTGIGIVSSLLCSQEIPNNTEVLQVKVTDNNGKITTQKLRAGRDTSEWAYDCSDIHPLMRHSRAVIFDSTPYERKNISSCDAHNYVSILPLNKLSNVKNLELKWLGKSGAIGIQKISLFDDNTKTSYLITEKNNFLADIKRWRHVENINRTSVYENLGAMSRAWLVPEVISLKPEQVITAIKSSRLPDGRFYQPSKIALVEENLDFKAKNFDLGATSNLVKLDDTHIQIKTNSQSPAFLVLSDVYYPGWKAKIDGKSTHIFQTNYVLRGVLIPEGNHVVEFIFSSGSFHIGAGISAASLCLLGYLFVRERKKCIINLR